MVITPRKRAKVTTAFAVVSCFVCPPASAAQIGEYFKEDQNIPVGTGAGGWAKATAKSLPYSYYPSVNKLDVAIQLTGELIRKARGGAGGTSVLERADVRVRNKKTGRSVASGTVPLDEGGYGRRLLGLPDKAEDGRKLPVRSLAHWESMTANTLDCRVEPRDFRLIMIANVPLSQGGTGF